MVGALRGTRPLGHRRGGTRTRSGSHECEDEGHRFGRLDVGWLRAVPAYTATGRPPTGHPGADGTPANARSSSTSPPSADHRRPVQPSHIRYVAGTGLCTTPDGPTGETGVYLGKRPVGAALYDVYYRTSASGLPAASETPPRGGARYGSSPAMGGLTRRG